MSKSFNFDDALKDLQSGKDLTGKDGVLMPLIKQLTEAAINAELEHHISNTEEPNRKNGRGSKTVKTGAGSFELCLYSPQEYYWLLPHCSFFKQDMLFI